MQAIYRTAPVWGYTMNSLRSPPPCEEGEELPCHASIYNCGGHCLQSRDPLTFSKRGEKHTPTYTELYWKQKNNKYPPELQKYHIHICVLLQTKKIDPPPPRQRLNKNRKTKQELGGGGEWKKMVRWIFEAASRGACSRQARRVAVTVMTC